MLSPRRGNDFNVPTPVAIDSRLLVATENNGARLYAFDSQGCILPDPMATYADLAPDCHSPVAAGGRLFGVAGSLHCLDLANGLEPLWTNDDRAFADYASIIASADRVLVATHRGELWLFDARSTDGQPISKLAAIDQGDGMYSHPAIAGKRLYLRGSHAAYCIDLTP
jgi:outer membrane protein assembly factor BamB